ncbi:MAG: hypothetical protein WBG71_12395 [Leeuwenhoekiella sp.]
MITKVPDSVLDKINLEEDEIILNGPPGQLTGNIKLSNKNADTARVRYLNLLPTPSTKTKSLDDLPLYVNSKLRAGESRLEGLTLALPADTPPGTYENQMTLGGKKRLVKMVVQPTISVLVTPKRFTFQGNAPGTQHTATLTVTNAGNMPFQIPEVKHVAPLDMDLLCRAFGFGFRRDKSEGFTDTLDHVMRNIKENLPNWAKSQVKQAGTIIAPGKSLLVDITVTIPRDAKAEYDYDLDLRFWDHTLLLEFKSHQEPQKPTENEQ